MTTVSSSVLLHTLLFGTEDELAQSRRCLHAKFEALLELEQYWPGVRSMVSFHRPFCFFRLGFSFFYSTSTDVSPLIQINRLISFQNTCLSSRMNTCIDLIAG
jgi:hypothetical protein